MAFASTPQSVNVIKFGDAKTLFVGDSKSATLCAYTIASPENAKAQQGYNIHDLSQKIANFAKINPLDILVRDMAITPANKGAYKIEVSNSLEDIATNSMNQVFDHKVGDFKVQQENSILTFNIK